uniref:Alphaaminoadipic semialdehyde synthase putative n=1 Tax=Albugo laibachii Nc14 TaxID=890382 RepID=F0WRP2_9STRA|nr:alphaaminoadipic semialdehyde synthase putative [Albugo laibachii Nc14]|eukprot:CCA24006.1 alphaaminoadipic semialdehyde synthase putative [Albugo laibachii Nc14]
MATQKKLSFEPGERDMALRSHEFGTRYEDGTMGKQTTTFVGYRYENGDTIMEKTVGITAVTGVQLILENVVRSCGMLWRANSNHKRDLESRVFACGSRRNCL